MSMPYASHKCPLLRVFIVAHGCYGVMGIWWGRGGGTKRTPRSRMN